MAKVIVSLDGLVLQEVTLSKERTTIGRKSHNDIHIDNLAVSGDHAAIVQVVEDHFIEDLGSTNGTLVNGKPVKRQLLKSNDVIELGKFKLEFVGRTAPQGQDAADYEKTMVFRRPAVPAAPAASGPQASPAPASAAARTPPAASPASQPAPGPAAARSAPAAPPASPPSPAASPAAPPVAPATAAAAARAAVPAPGPAGTATPPAAARPAAAAAGASPRAASSPPAAVAREAAVPSRSAQPWGAIRIVSGPGAGAERPLTKPVTTIGKAGVQVAMLTRRTQGYYLTHVEGSNQPQVNGQRIGAEPFPLNDHDVIELTGLKVEFLLRQGSATSTARKTWIVWAAIAAAIVLGFVLWRMRR